MGNLERRYIGRTDEALCDVGIAQVQALRRQLPASVDRLFVSPMQRTRQTAELLFPQMPYRLVPEFCETDFGRLEGKTADELSQMPEYRQWVASLCKTPIPGGEDVAAFKERCCRGFLHCIRQIPEHATAAFVVHGGVIMAILERYARPQRDFYAYHIANGAFLLCNDRDGILHIPEAQEE